MISKPAIMLLGLINERELNAYEIIKQLSYMNVKWWFNIADSTVYATLKALERKNYIVGKTKKIGNMPNRTIYTITKEGKEKLKDTIKEICILFDYDTVLFSIAAFYIDVFEVEERIYLLDKRIKYLNQYLKGIEKQLPKLKENRVPYNHIDNVKRMIEIIKAEICGAEKLLEDTKNIKR
ncbi:PadR family transcriptional regulator [Clostridium oceanicum]|uniref:Transcription regulator PadR N-terminal domain-containing protein n=1 Tax=Clostridium oceanicum TaxID=1543 RepID=A0ABP3UQK6_9CLOT